MDGSEHWECMERESELLEVIESMWSQFAFTVYRNPDEPITYKKVVQYRTTGGLSALEEAEGILSKYDRIDENGLFPTEKKP